jgi:predicted protein tyrosine phosphatase
MANIFEEEDLQTEWAHLGTVMEKGHSQENSQKIMQSV